MFGVETSYRPAQEGDVQDISRVFADAYDDLYRRRGFLETPINPLPPNPVFAFLIRKTPHAFWVAEEDGNIIGFSDSFVRGSFWYFSWLFVSPSSQGQNIGRSLLERTLTSWKDVEITNRATITFAFNPVSQFLYMKYGMYPREPTYYVETLGNEVLERIEPTLELTMEALSSPQDASETIGQLDKTVLGFTLDWHHRYFFETKARCYLFKDHGNPVGYVYVRPNGGIGPLAVGSGEYTRPVLERALHLSASQGVEKVRYYMPGSNTHAVELALKYRMRLDPYVFMSTKPFAKWENYIFHSAALM